MSRGTGYKEEDRGEEVEREIGEEQGAIKVEMDIIRKRNGKR